MELGQRRNLLIRRPLTQNSLSRILASPKGEATARCARSFASPIGRGRNLRQQIPGEGAAAKGDGSAPLVFGVDRLESKARLVERLLHALEPRQQFSEALSHVRGKRRAANQG